MAAAEKQEASDKDLEKLIIIALACEPPAESGLAVSHWTPPELAREAIKRVNRATAARDPRLHARPADPRARDLDGRSSRDLG